VGGSRILKGDGHKISSTALVPNRRTASALNFLDDDDGAKPAFRLHARRDSVWLS
jgi:hypothetical protein